MIMQYDIILGTNFNSTMTSFQTIMIQTFYFTDPALNIKVSFILKKKMVNNKLDACLKSNYIILS